MHRLINLIRAFWKPQTLQSFYSLFHFINRDFFVRFRVFVYSFFFFVNSHQNRLVCILSLWILCKISFDGNRYRRHGIFSIKQIKGIYLFDFLLISVTYIFQFPRIHMLKFFIRNPHRICRREKTLPYYFVDAFELFLWSCGTTFGSCSCSAFSTT